MKKSLWQISFIGTAYKITVERQMNHNNGLLEGRNISYGIIKLFFSTKAKKTWGKRIGLKNLSFFFYICLNFLYNCKRVIL